MRAGRPDQIQLSLSNNNATGVSHEGNSLGSAVLRLFVRSHGGSHRFIDPDMQAVSNQRSRRDQNHSVLAGCLFKDEDDPPVIDTDKLIANAKKLGEYCSANPTIGLITAADKLFDK